MSAGIPYIFHQNLVLRTPAFPFITKYNSDIFEYLLNNTAFLAAINIASPVLLEEAIKLKENKITSEKEIVKIRSSLLKYYQRMYSRCTPFGLFSGCSLVNWKKGETNVLLNEACNYSHSRLDMHYLCALIQHISKIPVIKDRLLYSPNSSIYKLSNKLRYIEYNYIKSQRVYQISEVNFTSYLDNTLKVASPGVTIEVLINSLINKQDISRNDAEEFINEMISAQIIVNELEPSITGEEFIHQVLVVLNKINFDDNSIINSINRNLKEIKENMADIETYKEDNYSLYRAIYKSIDKIDVEFEENKLIQTDLFKCPSQNCISIDHQDKLFLAITFLNGLFFQNQNLNLKNFVTRYNDRYEDRKMPLLQVLDSEIGIGYPERRINIKSPILDQIHLLVGDDKDELNIKWDPTQTWLFNKLKSATEEKKYQINILDEDLKNFPPNRHDMPPSQSVMFRLIDAETIVFENCSGSSASNLLGRFAHGNTKIGELIFDIAQEETNQNPSILFAEILHLPQSRVGNILQHPPLGSMKSLFWLNLLYLKNSRSV